MKKPVKPNPEFKTLLMVLKKEAGVTSKSIAEALGVTQQTFVKITQHLDRCSLAELSIIASKLNIKLSAFVEVIAAKSTDINNY